MKTTIGFALLAVTLATTPARATGAEVDGGGVQAIYGGLASDGPRCEFLHVERGCWGWSTRNLLLELGFVGVGLLDYLQTRTIVLQPRYQEIGPFLPSRPTMAQLHVVAIVGTLAHVALATAMPRPWRDVFQVATFTIEAANVTRNFTIGLTLTF